MDLNAKIIELEKAVDALTRKVSEIQSQSQEGQVPPTESREAVYFSTQPDVSPTFALTSWLTVNMAGIIPPDARSAILYVAGTTNNINTSYIKARIDDAGSEFTVHEFDPTAMNSSTSATIEVPIKMRSVQLQFTGSFNSATVKLHGYR